uniref:Triosephosphate isomerase n=2 Tax=Choreotrichia TaxID=141411 RepID=A0A7S3MLH5_9SPIT|mmetsp:Transcript_34608/g.45511  ORF Transcript_34608/g.45511 Transcript_34608/m.45511 type:complete len:265 (+) Transcript_34608:32-826(+)|eukprot:Macronucleus_1825.p1 GENE.Macronucleus_1825~~Macronucleus_1825.p1  ORF type:complete len:265 (+),score=121.31 Macronucleus_1825:1-795(+)
MVEAGSQRKYIIGGNWKSNGSVDFVRNMCTNTLNTMEFDESRVEVVVAPISLHITSTKTMLNSNILVSSQNISAEGNGAYTGEISAEQIIDFGLQWTLVGHSERRKLFGETDEIVAKKVARSQAAGLKTILCIGETLEQREAGQTNDVLKQQLDAVKESISSWATIVIAYEPVWAIGTGKTATPAIAQEAHAYVRQWLTENVSAEVAAATRIQYGGSANAGNCGELIAQPDIDGFLVGGASLKPEFATIVKTVSDAHASAGQAE